MDVFKVKGIEKFSSKRVNTELVFDSDNARIVLFYLDAGQEIEPHVSPSSVSIVVLKGAGKWTGSEEKDFSEGDLCCYKPDEPHGFTAKEQSVLLAFITPSPK
jgi:quercetin dioxygenase-like cupin family protein